MEENLPSNIENDTTNDTEVPQEQTSKKRLLYQSDRIEYKFLGNVNGNPYKSKDAAAVMQDTKFSFLVKDKNGNDLRIYTTCASVPDNRCRPTYYPFKRNGFILTGKREKYYNDHCLAVVDYDIRKDIDPAVALAYVLSLIPEKYKDTLMVETGSGGLHVYFEVEGNVESKSFKGKYIDKKTGNEVESKLNNPEHEKYLIGVDTRGNGGKIFGLGTSFYEHPHEYRLFHDGIPLKITEEEFFSIFSIFVNKDVYDNSLHCKKGKMINNSKTSHLHGKQQEKIVDTWYQHDFGDYTTINDWHYDHLLPPTKDFWNGIYQVQSGHNNVEFFIWKIFIGDLLAHGYDIDEIVDHFEKNPELQPEFKSIETIAQCSARCHQSWFKFMREMMYAQLDDDTDQTLSVNTLNYEYYFPEYVDRGLTTPCGIMVKKKLDDNAILLKPLIDRTEDRDPKSIIKAAFSLKEDISKNTQVLKDQLWNWYQNQVIQGLFITSQVDTEKTKTIKEFVYDILDNDDNTKVFWFSPLRKALPIRYIREERNPREWMEIQPKVFIEEVKVGNTIEKHTNRENCLLAQYWNNSQSERWYDEDVANIIPYFCGCQIDAERYGQVRGLFDPEGMYGEIIIGRDRFFQCPYHSQCEDQGWIRMKNNILNDMSADSDLHFSKVYLTTIQQYPLLYNILNDDRYRQPDLIVIDENFLNWLIINESFTKPSKWIEIFKNEKHSLDDRYQVNYNTIKPIIFKGDMELRWLEGGKQGNVQIWFDNIEINKDSIWASPKRNKEHASELYKIWNIVEESDQFFGYINPPVDLMQNEDWKKAYNEWNEKDLVGLLIEYGEFHFCTRRRMNIDANTRFIFACATTPLDVVKEMFPEHEILLLESEQFKKTYVPNPTALVNLYKFKDVIQWGKTTIEKHFHEILMFMQFTQTRRPLVITTLDIEINHGLKDIKAVFPNAFIVHYGDALGRNDCFYEEINGVREYIDSIWVLGRFGFNELTTQVYTKCGISHVHELNVGTVIQGMGRGRFIELSDIPIWLFTDRDTLDDENYKEILNFSDLKKISRFTEKRMFEIYEAPSYKTRRGLKIDYHNMNRFKSLIRYMAWITRKLDLTVNKKKGRPELKH